MTKSFTWPTNYIGACIVVLSYAPVLFRFGYYDDLYFIGAKIITDILYISFGWLMISGFRQGPMRWLFTTEGLSKFHNILGLWAAVGLLAHPIGVVLHYQDWTIVLPFINNYDWKVSLGSLAIIILVLVVVSSHFIRHTKYDIWHGIHYLNYIFFPLLFIHSLVTLPLNSFIGVYYCIWAALVTIVSIWKLLFDWEILSFKTQIVSIELVATDTYNVRFTVPKSLHHTWKPGHYITVALKRWQDNHAFSISKINHDYTAEITFKILGNFSEDLSKQPIGTTLYITGTYGNLDKVIQRTTNDLVFIAGGIGITPYRGIIHDLLEKNISREMYLFYGARNEDYLAFDNEFTKLATSYKNLHYITICDAPKTTKPLIGYFSIDILKKCVPDILNKHYFICGPSSMVTHIKKALLELGIEENQITIEVFDY